MMKALQWDASVGAVRLVSVEPRLLGADDVLVRVEFSGVCGTDLHAMEGQLPLPGKVRATCKHALLSYSTHLLM